jgi:hypothetical protein
MVELAGVLVVVALIIFAVIGAGIPGTVSADLSAAVARVLGTNSSAGPHAAATGGAATPAAAGSSGAGRSPGAVGAAGSGSANRGPQSSRLPSGGQRPYVAPKKAHGKPQPVRGGGFEDANGNVWKWDPSGHGGPHWDVEHPDGSHTNVGTDGTVIGKDNFPNKAPKGSGAGSGGSGAGDTAKKAAGGAAIIGAVGTGVWWIGKLASPACGPAAPVCALVF